MSFSYGKRIKVTIFGQSHSPAIGVSIDGIPSGLEIDLDELKKFLQRRAPGRDAYSTTRTEKDEVEIISGFKENKNLSSKILTCGAPLTAIIRNTDARSSDYEKYADVPRPSHSDYAAFAKYGASHDIRGGGAFSGRMTAPLCIAGGIFLQLLKQKNIFIAAHIAQIGEVKDTDFDPVNVNKGDFALLEKTDFPVLDKTAGEKMLKVIEEAKAEGDSLGGIIECAAIGLPAGIGEPMFEGIENTLAQIIFAIPAVKGLEFGNGFAGSALKGSQNNDSFFIKDGKVKTRTNNHGGILGGISSGMPLLFRAAFKPTPSIAGEQDSVSLSTLTEVKLSITGRHDPCIVPRAVPCVEAATAIALYDALLGV